MSKEELIKQQLENLEVCKCKDCLEALKKSHEDTRNN